MLQLSSTTRVSVGSSGMFCKNGLCPAELPTALPSEEGLTQQLGTESCTQPDLSLLSKTKTKFENETASDIYMGFKTENSCPDVLAKVHASLSPPSPKQPPRAWDSNANPGPQTLKNNSGKNNTFSPKQNGK